MNKKDVNQQNHNFDSADKRKKQLLYLWWVTLAIGLIYVFAPRPSTVISEEITPSPIPTKQTKGFASRFVAPLATSRQASVKKSAPTATPTASPTITPTPEPVYLTHKVRQGEMLLSIAFEYDLEVEEIMVENEIDDPASLQIGQELVIPILVTPTPIPTPTPDFTPTPSPTPLLHIVEFGDSPLSIALQYGDTSVEAIMRANGILNPSGLQIGQELIIPIGTDLSEIPFQAQTIQHKLRPGDTILGLANAYGSTVLDILEANPEIEPTALQIGAEIFIPVTKPGAWQQAYAASSYSGVSPVTIPDPPAPGLVGLQQQMVMAINAHREAHGLPPYQEDPRISEIAWARAQDMDVRGYFGHITPEGKRAADFVRERGIQAGVVGENIERNVRPESETVEHSITWFMNDAPHRRNILHTGYNRIGVGVSKTDRFHTFVLIFATE